jgi:tape measure domain-containing protein
VASKETKLQIVIDAQNRTQGTFNALKGNLDDLRRQHEGLTDAMRGVGAAGAAAFTGLAFLTKGVIAAGATFEQTQIAFETMLGSAETAQNTLRELSRFAAKTPFELGQLEEASKRLLAYGMTADDLIPTLRMLGDISAGVGMDKLPQLILAFGQVKAATKLTGMELRQFSEAGVPLLGTLAEQLGKTEGEILEMVSAGQIGFEEVRKALASLTGEGGRFFNLMERQSGSLGGLWSNLKDQISLTARVLGEELLPYLKPVVEQLIAITGTVRTFVTENPQLAAGILMAALAFTGLLAVLFPLALMLPGLVLMWGGLSAAVVAFTALSAPAVLAIGAIVAVLVTLASQGYFTQQAWIDVWTGIKIIAAEAANAVIGTVEAMINFVIAGVNKAIDAINRVIKLAQKVPGIGSKLSTIGKISNVDFGTIDMGTVGASQMPGLQSVAPTVVNVTGNTFLDQDSAEKVGDLLMSRLKLSSLI